MVGRTFGSLVVCGWRRLLGRAATARHLFGLLRCKTKVSERLGVNADYEGILDEDLALQQYMKCRTARTTQAKNGLSLPGCLRNPPEDRKTQTQDDWHPHVVQDSSRYGQRRASVYVQVLRCCWLEGRSLISSCFVFAIRRAERTKANLNLFCICNPPRRDDASPRQFVPHLQSLRRRGRKQILYLQSSHEERTHAHFNLSVFAIQSKRPEPPSQFVLYLQSFANTPGLRGAGRCCICDPVTRRGRTSTSICSVIAIPEA